jgi:peptidoglycan/LPS O-acetylase OafA/YrhL
MIPTDLQVDRQPILRPEMPELDSIRGVAVLAVILYHGLRWARDLSPYPVSQMRFLSVMTLGQFGVNLFFVLSGFLITGLLLDSRSRPDYYRRFYIRRALRILPLYYGVLLVLAATRITSKSFLIMSLLYVPNLSQIFGITMSYAVLWSLGVEEHFYLLWPAVTRAIGRRQLMLVAAAIVVVSPILRLLCYYHAVRTDFLTSDCGFYTWNASDGLACGAFLAAIVRAFQSNRRRLLQTSSSFFLLSGIVAVAGFPFGIITRRTPVGAAIQSSPVNFFCAGLVGAFLLIGTGPWKWLVNWGWLRFLGYISYGLYLLHLLAFVAYDWLAARFAPNLVVGAGQWGVLWLRLAGAGLFAIGMAYASRVLFENPFLRLKSRLAPSSHEQA